LSAGAEDDAFILYTGGTSGRPKGVRLSHKNLMASLLQTAAWMGEMEKGKEVFLSILPSHQAFGLTLAMNLPIYLAGMSIHLPQFETSQVLAAVRKHQPTFFPASPPMATRSTASSPTSATAAVAVCMKAALTLCLAWATRPPRWFSSEKDPAPMKTPRVSRLSAAPGSSLPR